MLWVIVILEVELHPFAFVTVTVYVPGELIVFVAVPVDDPPLQL